jgi:hypothetical protein
VRTPPLGALPSFLFGRVSEDDTRHPWDQLPRLTRSARSLQATVGTPRLLSEFALENSNDAVLVCSDSSSNRATSAGTHPLEAEEVNQGLSAARTGAAIRAKTEKFQELAGIPGLTANAAQPRYSFALIATYRAYDPFGSPSLLSLRQSLRRRYQAP